MSFFSDDFLTIVDPAFLKRPLPKKQDAPVPQDEFEVAYTTPVHILLTDYELAALPQGEPFAFDSESYINYSLFIFKHLASGKYLVFEHPFNVGKLKWVLQRFLLIGFNSRSYDMPMANLALVGFDTRQLKLASNNIIFGAMLPYQIERTYKINILPTNHIDLIEVAPLQGSLKLYAGRLHCKRMQDLPIAHDAVLTAEEKLLIRDYCFNDVDNTELLFSFLKPQLELRYTLSNVYGVDLRSKSDAQIAEAVIGTELERLTGTKPEKAKNYQNYFFYLVPAFIKFKTPILQQLVTLIADTAFEVDESGAIKMPDSLTSLSVELGACTYRIGMGGLHSSEKTIAHKADNGFELIDRDVASYYPAIILNQGLFPRHLGKPFLQVYKGIVERRLAAKASGDKVTNDALKITINGSFGKLGNKWSLLYSPELLIQVTISGQLCLLLLIEMIEEIEMDGVRVISANTDGVLIECHFAFKDQLNDTIRIWESITGFTTEETQYTAVYSRDVNNYIAVKADGKVKVKGSYSERGSSGDTPLSRNPEAFICNDAAIAYLTVGTPVEETIRACHDIRRFVIVRNVKGGAVKSGKYLGKTIRWYYSTLMKGEINYQGSGNKVPNSDGGMPIMQLPTTVPDDLDYPRYVAIATSILVEIGAIPAQVELQGLLATYV